MPYRARIRTGLADALGRLRRMFDGGRSGGNTGDTENNLDPRIDRVEARIQAIGGHLANLDSAVGDLEAAISQTKAADDRQTMLLDRRVEELLARWLSISTALEGNAESVSELRHQVHLVRAMCTKAAEGSEPPVPTDDARSERAGTRSPHFRHVVPTMDLLYHAFEQQMRGSRDEILERFTEDHVDALIDLPSADLPIVDLGCGRGELVQLLMAAGQPAIGVDMLASQSEQAGGAEFVQSDMFSWLDERPDASVRAVVSLHVIEHLPTTLQIRLFFEARRVLVPGGLLLLETPNASSLAVGASTFWADPTHERPVHPEYLRFLANQAGFQSIEVKYLHQPELQLRGLGDNAELVGELNSLLLGPADVALLARLPGGTERSE